MKNREGIYKPRYRAKDGTIKESEVFWVRYSTGGRQMRESTGKTKITDAQVFLDMRRGDARKGVPIVPNADKVLFGSLLDDCITDYKLNGRKSLEGLTIRIEKHIRPYFGHWFAQSIRESDIQAYVLHRKEPKSTEEKPVKPAKAATINRELAAISKAFTLGIKNRKILWRPYFPALKENNVRRGFLEEEQLETLCGFLPDDIKVPVIFAFHTGWRMPSEVLTREWQHVDLNRGIVRLEVGETKNGKGRIFPLTPGLSELLKEQKIRTEQLQRKEKRIITLVFHHKGFSLVDSHRKPSRYFRNAWKSACEKAGLAGTICHDFRRSAVRRFERNGIPRQVGMQLSGHSTESVYRRYSIITEQDLFDAVKKLESSAPSKVLAK